MKKFISVLLTVVMTVSIISCLGVSSYAASPVIVTIDAIADSSSSDVVVVTAKLSEDSNLTGLNFKFKYDTGSLEYVSGSVSAGGIFGEEAVSDANSSVGVIGYAAVQTKAITKGGTFLTAKFKVKSSYSSAISGEVVEALDSDDNDVASTVSVSVNTSSASSYVTKISMYRLYNPNSGEHFYTANSYERDNLVSLGWTYEGIGWYAPSSSSTPVYRLYNSQGGEHHYTTNAAERDNLVALGWTYESIGWYSDDNHGVPLYRQYNPNAYANNHNYTTNKNENDYLVSLGWQAEGIGWYGVA